MDRITARKSKRSIDVETVKTAMRIAAQEIVLSRKDDRKNGVKKSEKTEHFEKYLSELVTDLDRVYLGDRKAINRSRKLHSNFIKEHSPPIDFLKCPHANRSDNHPGLGS